MRPIDADALLEAYWEEQRKPGVYSIEKIISEQPIIEAEPVVHSWWEKSAEGYRICHHCKADVAIFSGHKNYCPNCGARMDGGETDE